MRLSSGNSTASTVVTVHIACARLSPLFLQQPVLPWSGPKRFSRKQGRKRAVSVLFSVIRVPSLSIQYIYLARYCDREGKDSLNYSQGCVVCFTRANPHRVALSYGLPWRSMSSLRHKVSLYLAFSVRPYPNQTESHTDISCLGCLKLVNIQYVYCISTTCVKLHTQIKNCPALPVQSVVAVIGSLRNHLQCR